MTRLIKQMRREIGEGNAINRLGQLMITIVPFIIVCSFSIKHTEKEIFHNSIQI
jgi:hypothetical protein